MGFERCITSWSRQGYLGGCWFLAAAAALAEKPERIKKMFRNTEYNPNNLYQTKWYVGGSRVSVIVDDKLPVNKDGTPVNTNISKNNA